jgi:hypothetical protein
MTHTPEVIAAVGEAEVVLGTFAESDAPLIIKGEAI